MVPLVGAEYFDVGLEETVLGGCSTKEVSVVLAMTIDQHVFDRKAHIKCQTPNSQESHLAVVRQSGWFILGLCTTCQ